MTTGFSFGDSGHSATFNQLGEFVRGTVLDMAEVQQTDFVTKKPLTWDDGNPRMQYRITLQTDQRDPADPTDDGKRNLYVKGSRQPRADGTKGSLCAVLDAIAAAGAGTDLKYGATLTVQWTSGAGVTGDPKGYTAWYEPPAMPLEQPTQHRQAPQQPAVPQQPFESQGPPPAWAQAPQQPQQPAAPPAPPVQQQLPVPGQTWGSPAGPPQQPVAPQGAAWDQPQPPAGPPSPAGMAAANPYAGQQPPSPYAQAGPVQQAYVAPQQQPAPGLTAQVGNVTNAPTAETIAGLQAAGIDPATVYGPNWQQQVVPQIS